MKQISFIVSAVFMTGIILLGFQNCGQPGQIVQGSSGTSSAPLSSSLEIAIPNPDGAPAPASGSGAPVDPTLSINDTSTEAICRDLAASDILLSVDQVTSDGPSFTLTDVDHSISIVKATVGLEASASGDVNEIRIVLNSAGNLLLGTNEIVYDLKTPSGQTSGFKVRLASTTHVEAGHKYELALNIDLSQQIVRAGKKCILKPTCQKAVLTPL